MTRYAVVTSVLALIVFGGCDEIQVDENGQLVAAQARMADSAAATGTVECGESEEVYENTSGADRCKQVSVTNGCEGDSEIEEWFREDGKKIYDGDAPARPIPGGKTKVYDITVKDGRGLDIKCATFEEEEDPCCSYTIESCNKRSKTVE